MKNINFIAGTALAMLLMSATPCLADTTITATPDTLQAVLDTCNDSETNHVTVLLAEGIYNPIICRSFTSERYIDLIGQGDVSVESHSGLYIDPAAELRLNGTVENIKFCSYNPGKKLNDKGAYAVHADYGSQHILFKDCEFVSYQSAAIGAGLTSGSEITLEDCIIENLSEPGASDYWRLGAVYAHTADYSDELYKDEATLKIKNCVLKAPDKAYSNVVTEKLDDFDIKVVRI